MGHDSGFRQRGHVTSAVHKQRRHEDRAAKRFEERSNRRYRKNIPQSPAGDESGAAETGTTETPDG